MPALIDPYLHARVIKQRWSHWKELERYKVTDLWISNKKAAARGDYILRADNSIRTGHFYFFFNVKLFLLPLVSKKNSL